MDLHLIDKVILVTGSSKGIGFAIAAMLHKEGCKVVLNGRNSELLDQAVSMLPGAYGITADVTNPHEAKILIKKAINIFGQLDGVVCNVGSGQSVAPGNENFNEWQQVFSNNLWSATNIVEAATDVLANRKGSIVCISSICGQEVIPGAPVTYSAAKAALNAYVRGISRPLGKQGIRINAISAGNILFNGSVWAKKLKEDEHAVTEMLKTNVSLETLGIPDDIASLTAYLLSSKAGFATGAIFTVDGGQVHG